MVGKNKDNANSKTMKTTESCNPLQYENEWLYKIY